MRNNASFHGTIEFKEMTHDKLHRAFVNMVVFPTVTEIGQSNQRLVNGSHFKGWKIMNIFMP
jgi:hypothetical protein